MCVLKRVRKCVSEGVSLIEPSLRIVQELFWRVVCESRCVYVRVYVLMCVSTVSECVRV